MTIDRRFCWDKGPRPQIWTEVHVMLTQDLYNGRQQPRSSYAGTKLAGATGVSPVFQKYLKMAVFAGLGSQTVAQRVMDSRSQFFVEGSESLTTAHYL